MSGAELEIRSRRAQFNRAIAAGDADAIAPLLARDCVMVTGTDSAAISGRAAQVRVWRREFASEGRMHYARIPERVIVSAVEPLAMEDGAWHGRDAETGQSLASGTYFAKWRRMDENWVIEAEVFVTLA